MNPSFMLIAMLVTAPADTITPVRDTVAVQQRVTSSRVLLPFVFYTPETRIGGGAMAGYYRRLAPDLPVSSVLMAATVTARGQFSADLLPEAYLAGGLRFEGSLGVHHFPDSYFGVGPGRPDDVEEQFTARKVAVRAQGQSQVFPGMSVGAVVSYRWEEVVEVEEGGELSAADGGRWTGIGGLVTFDTRDDVLSPRGGVYTQLSATMHLASLGSTSTYQRAVLDARGYLPIGAEPVLAIRILFDAAGGEAPVLDLPALGGSDRLRGYLQGRHRDRYAASLQAELRTPVRGRLGAAAFAEAGQVAGAPRSLRWSDPEASVGVGVRWRLADEGARIRLDFARGRRGSGLYITVGEAF